MQRKEFVNKMFETLEENHVNLYHDISKEEFEKRKQEFLKNCENLDELHFEAGILKLFALFRDAHTGYYFPFDYVDAKIENIGKDFYIKNEDKFEKIKEINGYPIELVIDKLKEIVCYEVEPWLYRELRYIIGSPKALNMVDLGMDRGKIVFTTEKGNDIFTKVDKPKNYEFKVEDGILHIKYSKCRNEDDYPFAEFMEDIKKTCKKLPKACVVDVRNNSGGNSEIVNPLQDWLKENNIKTYVLMNGGVFSSGIFVLARFKKELNATLIGTDAGQPTTNYGEVSFLEVGGKKFKGCKKYFKFTSENVEGEQKPYYQNAVFDYLGAIKPDVYIERTLEDLNTGVDGQKNRALEFIKKDLEKQKDKEL